VHVAARVAGLEGVDDPTEVWPARRRECRDPTTDPLPYSSNPLLSESQAPMTAIPGISRAGVSLLPTNT
jgi:hypothetical protein